MTPIPARPPYREPNGYDNSWLVIALLLVALVLGGVAIANETAPAVGAEPDWRAE